MNVLTEVSLRARSRLCWRLASMTVLYSHLAIYYVMREMYVYFGQSYKLVTCVWNIFHFLQSHVWGCVQVNIIREQKGWTNLIRLQCLYKFSSCFSWKFSEKTLSLYTTYRRILKTGKNYIVNMRASAIRSCWSDTLNKNTYTAS